MLGKQLLLLRNDQKVLFVFKLCVTDLPHICVDPHEVLVFPQVSLSLVPEVLNYVLLDLLYLFQLEVYFLLYSTLYRREPSQVSLQLLVILPLLAHVLPIVLGLLFDTVSIYLQPCLTQPNLFPQLRLEQFDLFLEVTDEILSRDIFFPVGHSLASQYNGHYFL